MTVIELCEPPEGWAALQIPALHLVEQRFAAPPPVDAAVEVGRQWSAAWGGVALPPGSSVAVGVGSRGIDGLPEVVRAVVARLREAGCRPYVVSAMGSHGNATAAGQAAVLAERGITEEAVGAPIRASVDVVSLGEADGLPLFLDKEAAAADGIVLVNRVKPHTDFVGRVESGLTKMLVIGLGNEAGATACHRHALTRGLADVVTTAGRALLARAPVLLGVALVENQRHRVCEVRVLPAPRWETDEPELLEYARTLLPGLPLDDIDVLLVDEMGKDVSGAGMDPNVTGRPTGVWTGRRESPRITRIVVRSLTEATEGNACGLGSVDMAPLRLTEAIDLAASATNALASCAPEDGKLPLTFATDHQALAAALATLRPYTLGDLRLVHIRNTLSLERLEVSPGCLARLRPEAELFVAPEPEALVFDGEGALVSRLSEDGGAPSCRRSRDHGGAPSSRGSRDQPPPT